MAIANDRQSMNPKVFITLWILITILYGVYKFKRCPKCRLRYSDPTHDEEFCGIVAAVLIHGDQIKRDLGMSI